MHGVVEVSGGRVRGVDRGGAWSFSGIPYAGSTGGDRRWRPPAPPAPWAGIRECDRFGAVAPQTQGMMEMALGGTPEPTSEDCLHLNIWTPGLDAARRPVMVWIHGGSFMTGSGSMGLYRGGLLASDGDVVVVTLNYRLGLLGFLAHPSLDEEGQTWFDGSAWDGVGNWGLADQVAALAWVRDHIVDFGGDPGNVTLFGESAGGMSVSTLLAVPAARGLFHRAIVESGPPYTCGRDVAADRAERLASMLGVPPTGAGFRSVPVDRLVAVAAEFAEAAGGFDAGLLMTPVVDDKFLPVAPAVAVEAGSVSEVPLLIGTNRDEAAFFVLGNERLQSLDLEGLRRWVRRVTPDPAEADSLITAVTVARSGRDEPTDPRQLWCAIASEYLFRVGSVRLADFHAGAATDGVGTFSYLFTWESPLFDGVLGSCHALEIPFVFGTVKNPVIQGFAGGGEAAFALSTAIRGSWTSFARNGVPAAPATVDEWSPGLWETWEPGRRPTTVLGPWPHAGGLLHQVDDPRGAELEAVGAVMSGHHGHTTG